MTAARSTVSRRAGNPRVVVVGAGAFGGWTALQLRRMGAGVTLVDAWGPGNARASSGGETRVIRATYGTRAVYTSLAARAMELWRDHDQRGQHRLFTKTGALWLFGRDNTFGRASAEGLDAVQLPYQWWTPAEAARRYPQVSMTGIDSVLYEPEAGYLLARQACEHVVERLVAEGGRFQLAAVDEPVRLEGGDMKRLEFRDGGHLAADAFVFACGPWLGRMFPDVVGANITSTRQEVYYFGVPAGDARFSEGQLPVWIDFTDRPIYGIPGKSSRGFKVADDTSGPAFDPTNGSRELTRAGIDAARVVVARRFPVLADAPFISGEVCQYEVSPDSHFIVDQHPGASNVWIAGGGSGHGYKMGPALGELLASAVLGRAPLAVPEWRLARFEDSPREQGRWV
jgi:sarcosine oxidase